MQMFLTPPTQTTEMGAIHPNQQTGVSSNAESPESFALVFEECQKQLSPTPTDSPPASDAAASETLPLTEAEAAPPLFIHDTVQTLLLNLQALPTATPTEVKGSPSVPDSAPSALATELSAGTPSLSLPLSGISLPFENPLEPTSVQTPEQTETAKTDVTLTKSTETAIEHGTEGHTTSLAPDLPVAAVLSDSASNSPQPSDRAATVAGGPDIQAKTPSSAAPAAQEMRFYPESEATTTTAKPAIAVTASEEEHAAPASGTSAPNAQTPPDSAPKDLPNAESPPQNPMIHADRLHAELSKNAGSPSTALTEVTSAPFSEKPSPPLSNPLQPEGPQPLSQGDARPNTPELLPVLPFTTGTAEQPEAKSLMVAPHQGSPAPSPDSPMAKPVAPENLPKAPAETSELRFYPLGERIRLLRQTGQNQMRLNLQPAELGRVSLQIVQSDQDLHLHILTDTAMAKELLESQMGQLKQSLLQQGLQLQQYLIEVRSELAGQGFDQERPPQQSAYESRQNRFFDWDEADFELDLSDLPLPKTETHHVNYLA